MAATDRARLLRLAARTGVFTAGTARQAGIHSQQITRLVDQGILERVSRGQYRLRDRPITEQHAIVQAAVAIPRGVICLLSALTLHGIGTQLPPDIWIAIERRARKPRVPELPLRIVRFSGAAFREGIEERLIEGVGVRVYSVPKTLADLFKLRNAIGLDVALEALRDAWQRRMFTVEALDRAARVCRVERVMRPYVEAIFS